MPIRHAAILVGLIVGAFSAAVSAPAGPLAPEPTLLGVPFGGKLTLGLCPDNTDRAQRPCWIGKPFKSQNGSLGYVHLPQPDQRPAWAADAMFQLDLDASNRVQWIKVMAFGADSRFDIADSVSRRFGPPQWAELKRAAYPGARWKSAEGAVELHCDRENCWTEFRTAASQAELGAELAQREKVNASRPKAP